HATSVELCLFDDASARQERLRLPLPERDGQVWHGYIPQLRPGQLYGYRVSGPWDPEAGHRFNARKVLLDPYAKAIGRRVEWNESLFGHTAGDEDDLRLDDRDSAAFAPLAAVVDPAFTWGDDRPPRHRWERTVI